MLTPLIDKQYITNTNERGGDGFYKLLNAVDGNGIISKDFIEAMEDLTLRDDLGEKTLIRYEKVFSSRGLLQKKRAWWPVGMKGYREEFWRMYTIDRC